MNRIIRVVLGGAVGAAICVGSWQRLAYASSDVDCSKLTKWKSDHDYRKGELVWFKPGVENRGREYRCNDASCRSQPDRNSNWKLVAACKAATDPK
jgi:hypothetical protein